MSQRHMRPEKIRDIASLRDCASLALSEFRASWQAAGGDSFGDIIWFRGAPKASGHLVPRVFRDLRDHPTPLPGHIGPPRYSLSDEATMLKEFIERAPGLLSPLPAKDDVPGWLTYMRHYGVPTRMLDWSESALIAAHFAVDKTGKDEEARAPGILWALSPRALSAWSLVERWVIPTFEMINEPVSAVVECLTDGQQPQGPNGFFPVKPFAFDRRMAAQHTAFTLHGTPVGLDEIVTGVPILMGFEIPPEAKGRLADELLAAGVSQAGLFPQADTHAAQLDAIGSEIESRHRARVLKAWEARWPAC